MVYDAGFTGVLGERRQHHSGQRCAVAGFEVAARKYRLGFSTHRTRHRSDWHSALRNRWCKSALTGDYWRPCRQQHDPPGSRAGRDHRRLAMYTPGTRIVLRNLKGSGAMSEIVRFDVVRQQYVFPRLRAAGPFVLLEHRGAPPAEDHAQHPDRVRRDGHRHRGAARHRDGAPRRHRGDAPQPVRRGPGPRGRSGEALARAG